MRFTGAGFTSRGDPQPDPLAIEGRSPTQDHRVSGTSLTFLASIVGLNGFCGNGTPAVNTGPFPISRSIFPPGDRFRADFHNASGSVLIYVNALISLPWDDGVMNPDRSVSGHPGGRTT